MYGYVSSSLDLAVAKSFMSGGTIGKDQSRVLYEIYWDWNFDYYIIDEGMFSDEKEVLLNDGTTYKIEEITQKPYSKTENYYFIKLRIMQL